MSKRKEKPKTGFCVLCGKEGIITREHVPPKCLFLKPRPQNTITVPLCEGCNHFYHLDDEYFRILASVHANPSDQQWRLFNEKVIGSSLARGEGLKKRLDDEYMIIQNYARSNPIELYGGGELPNELLPYLRPFDAKRINSVIEKIVKCLHFHHFERRFEGELRIVISDLLEQVRHSILNQPSGKVGYNNEFVYQYKILDSRSNMWLLIFFERHEFTIRTNEE